MQFTYRQLESGKVYSLLLQYAKGLLLDVRRAAANKAEEIMVAMNAAQRAREKLMYTWARPAPDHWENKGQLVIEAELMKEDEWETCKSDFDKHHDTVVEIEWHRPVLKLTEAQQAEIETLDIPILDLLFDIQTATN